MEDFEEFEKKGEAIAFLEHNYNAGNWLFGDIIEYVMKQPEAERKDILSDLLDRVDTEDQEKILALLSGNSNNDKAEEGISDTEYRIYHKVDRYYNKLDAYSQIADRYGEEMADSLPESVYDEILDKFEEAFDIDIPKRTLWQSVIWYVLHGHEIV